MNRIKNTKICLLASVYIILILSMVIPPQFVLAQSSDMEALRAKSVKSFNVKTENSVESLKEKAMQSTGASIPSELLLRGTHYNVHLVGETLRPGTYKVLPSDRLSDLIGYSGGLEENGSERLIQVRRQGKIRVYDLFSYYKRGHLNQNPYLLDGDVVFVPLKKGEILIEGPVRRPGKYELTRSSTLRSVINLAGGFTTGISKREPIRIVRYNGSTESKNVIEVPNNKKAMGRTKVLYGDTIVLPHLLVAKNKFDYKLNRIPGDNLFYPTSDDNVYVTGAVLNPGPYPFRPNFTHKEYVSLAGSTEHSKISHVKLVSKDGKRKRIKKATQINPGDTIFVPQKYWRAETVVQWLSTLSSLTLSTIVITDKLQD